MTEREALKLALDAITQYLAECPDPSEEAVEGLCDAASVAREALAQPEQEYDWKDLYEKEKRSSAMWIAKYEEVAGPAPKAYPVAQPEQDGNVCARCGGIVFDPVLAQPEERNFCPRCGKRLGQNDWDVHTCTPSQLEQE